MVCDQGVPSVVVLANVLVVGKNCLMTTTAPTDQLFGAEETDPGRWSAVPPGRERTFRPYDVAQ